MTQFALSDDLAVRLGITLTTAEETRAAALLTVASGLIQSETGQTISRVADDVLIRGGEYGDRLRLPERPVDTVARIQVTGPGIAISDLADDLYYLDGDEIVRATYPAGLEAQFIGPVYGWFSPLYKLTITYSHGYSVIPELVKVICIEMVARVWGNPGGAKSEAFGSGTTVFGDTRGLLLLDYERDELNDLLRRRAGSVQLR
jgi:hypothetical protein